VNALLANVTYAALLATALAGRYTRRAYLRATEARWQHGGRHRAGRPAHHSQTPAAQAA
jgi:hypothetical protein